MFGQPCVCSFVGLRVAPSRASTRRSFKEFPGATLDLPTHLRFIRNAFWPRDLPPIVQLIGLRRFSSVPTRLGARPTSGVGLMATRKINVEQDLTRRTVQLADRYLELLLLRAAVERTELNGRTPTALIATANTDHASRTRFPSEARRRRSRSLCHSLVLLAAIASIVSAPMSLGASRCRPIDQHARSRRAAPASASFT
jgi:hypothetical protein